ncbi:MAG: MATE family efflux transporter [Lachnospiraceae bacterium]|jgi:putative MATE family efflux protein
MSNIAVTKKKKVGLDLTEGSVMRGLVIFAIPIILANLIQQLYSLVDLIVIGQFMGSDGTVGVSTGGEVADMLTPVATAFGTAGQIYISQLIGAKDHKKLRSAIGTLVSTMMTMAVILMAVSLIFCVPLLRIINCPEEAFREAEIYMIITSLGMPFIFGYNAICGILRGLGESKRPMLFIIVAAVVNIVLDVLLVAVFHMDVAGTAIATVVSQATSCIAAFCFMYQWREQFDLELKASCFKPDKEAVRVIMSLGIPQAMRSMLVRVSMLWVNASVNSYGLTVSATNSVGNKLQKFLEVYCTGFSQASAAMVGQNLGAREHERAKKTVLYSFYICTALATIVSVICYFWPNQVFGIFTKEAEVLEMGAVYLKIMIVHFFFSALTSCYQSMIIGCGYSSMNFVIGILDGVICKIGLSLFFATAMGMGAYGYFWGTALSRVLPGIICVAYFYSGKWKERHLLTETKSEK